MCFFDFGNICVRDTDDFCMTLFQCFPAIWAARENMVGVCFCKADDFPQMTSIYITVRLWISDISSSNVSRVFHVFGQEKTWLDFSLQQADVASMCPDWAELEEMYYFDFGKIHLYVGLVHIDLKISLCCQEGTDVTKALDDNELRMRTGLQYTPL